MMRISLGFGLVLAGCTAVQTPHMPDGQNRVVDIVNTTDLPLQFTALNAERRGLNRQPSIEGDVAANYYLTLNFDDGSGACLFDLRAEFSSGQGAEAKRFNTCTDVSWVVAP